MQQGVWKHQDDISRTDLTMEKQKWSIFLKYVFCLFMLHFTHLDDYSIQHMLGCRFSTGSCSHPFFLIYLDWKEVLKHKSFLLVKKTDDIEPGEKKCATLKSKYFMDMSLHTRLFPRIQINIFLVLYMKNIQIFFFKFWKMEAPVFIPALYWSSSVSLHL